MSTWKSIPGYDGLYDVSDAGEVRNAKSNWVLTQLTGSGGHRSVNLWRESDRKMTRRPIHRLVAQAFIPNPDSKPHVFHIGGVAAGDSVFNLQWTTAQETTKLSRRRKTAGSEEAGQEKSDSEIIEFGFEI